MPFLVAIPVVVVIGVLLWEAHRKAAAAAVTPAAAAVAAASGPVGVVHPPPLGGGMGLKGGAPGASGPSAPVGANVVKFTIDPAQLLSTAGASDQIHSAAAKVLAGLPSTFTNDMGGLFQSIASASLQYLVNNPTPANCAKTVQQLLSMSQPEAQAAGNALASATQSIPGMSRYQTG